MILVVRFFLILTLFFSCTNEKLSPYEIQGRTQGTFYSIKYYSNLNLINKYNDSSFIMSYSYGRALQQGALKYWSKNIKNIEGTQQIFNHRAKMNTLAAQGKWSKDLEI